MLGRRAAKLFAHVRDTLQWTGLSSVMGADYSSVLRSNLLAAPSYCAFTPRDTFQGQQHFRIDSLSQQGTGMLCMCLEFLQSLCCFHLLKLDLCVRAQRCIPAA